MRKKRLMINIYPADYQYIKDYVDNNDTNVCELIRNIINDWVDWHKDETKE